MRKSILFFSIALTAITLGFTACSSDNNDDTPSVADRVAGTYTGTDTLTIGGTYGPYETAGCRYVITSAGDSSVTLTENEVTYASTFIGDVTQGTLTIKNIPYNKTTGTFYLNLEGAGAVAHVKCVSHGITTMDSDYTLTSGYVRITPLGSGRVRVDKTYRYGKMPFDIVTVYRGSSK